MSRRLAAVAALAVVLGCAGCDSDVLDSARGAASSAGDQLTSEAKQQLASQADKVKAEAAAEAKRKAAEVAAQAEQKLHEQVAAATTAAKAAADKATTAVRAAASAVPLPTAVPTPLPSPTAPTRTVTGTFTSQEIVDVSGGSVPCATLANVVGQAVGISTGTEKVSGQLTACAWSAPGVLGSSPVFSIVVERVPLASSYDISIGDRVWKISGTTLAAAGWQLSLT